MGARRRAGAERGGRGELLARAARAVVPAVAALVALAVGACPADDAATRAARAPAVERKGAWPESWATEFGLRCASAGEDVRLCTCVATEVQKRWTPEQFKALGADRLDAEMRACRERLDMGR